MNATDTAPCIEALLVEQTWLRRLAGALTRDGDVAEDLAQETWVTALSSPPRSATRTWLGKVFRSRLYDHSRSRQRRELREQAVFNSAVEPVATPEEITTRVELLRRVAGHMLALDEGVRQVLYLRYVEDELAGCLRTAIDQALGQVEPPGCTYAWLHEWRLDFPNPTIDLKASDEE